MVPAQDLYVINHSPTVIFNHEHLYFKPPVRLYDKPQGGAFTDRVLKKGMSDKELMKDLWGQRGKALQTSKVLPSREGPAHHIDTVSGGTMVQMGMTNLKEKLSFPSQFLLKVITTLSTAVP